MTSAMGADNISNLVQQAEHCVSGVKDPELRKIAFTKVLDSLLSAGTTKPADRPKKTAPRQRAKGGPQAYVEELHSQGFFQKTATLAEVQRELINRGHSIPLTSLSGPMQTLCKRRVLRRHRSTVNGKEAFVYSNW